MFKNVARSLKIANQLRDEPKKSKTEKRKKALESLDGEARKEAEAAGELVSAIKDENFLVRQSRKKLTKFVARLQNVRALSAMRQGRTKDAGQSKGDKQKVVKFKLDEDEVYSDEKTTDYQTDSDDDDAYVSASETFYDLDDERAEVYSRDDHDNLVYGAGEKARKQLARNYSEEDLHGDKIILPEEQCDIPTFLHTQNCDPEVIEETRRLLKERFAKNPDSFYEGDYKRMLEDDWTVTRFLLRRRLDPRRTAKLMEECGKFRREYLMSEIQLWEFPVEFHLAGGLFKYAPDRVGNMTMYMRVKMYRRVPEISDVFKAFILCVLEQCDVACNGRGTAVVFDLSGAGLQNVDLGFLYWLLNSFRNYCPKGVSYILVYNLPWFLSATAKLAMTWMSETNRRALRFVQGKEIENFIAPENLPDYLGGTCSIDYKAVPEGSRPAVEVCDRMDITVAQAIKIKELFKEYLPDNYEASIPPAPPTDGPVHQAPDEAKQADSLASSDNYSQGSSSTVEAGSVPVVGLVSQASKFMAAN